MPTCKECKEYFPNKVVIDGKELSLNKRSYCLKCSPVGSQKGYNLRKRNNLNNSFKFKGLDKICPICEKVFKRNKNDVCSTCRNWYCRHIHKNKAIELLGGKCNRCGFKDRDCLSFHHTNSKDKFFTLSSNWGVKTWKDIVVELNKCELLCFNCHMKHHVNEKMISYQKVLDYYNKSESG